MNKTTLETILRNVPSWNDEVNATARKAFGSAMHGRQYGYDATLQAWTFFLQGWNMNVCDMDHPSA